MSKVEVLEAIQKLTLEEILEIIEAASQRLRQLLLPASNPATIQDDDLTSAQWESAIAINPSFAFLHDPEEDIYTLEDGKPVSYEG